jgi:3-deoxy-manno-octulosonate cytidylyltransferase (CMP-KDO synthetase)
MLNNNEILIYVISSVPVDKVAYNNHFTRHEAKVSNVIVIPARFGSTRLPGKPLVQIKGKSLLHRVWSIAKAIKRVDAVYIATDDKRISDHAQSFGAEVIMTPVDCLNGTERVFAAIETLNPLPEIILNLQGDAVLTPPWAIQALLDKMVEDKSIGLATTAAQMDMEQYARMQSSKSNGRVGGTTVVFDKNKNALYFSKTMIPFLRDKTIQPLPVYRHIGLYVFRYPMLKQYLSLSPSPLEITEGLEQLRALENGIPIKVVTVDYQGRTHWAVDSQDDVTIVEKIISEEGELV